MNYENEISEKLRGALLDKYFPLSFPDILLYYFAKQNLLEGTKGLLWETELPKRIMKVILNDLGVTKEEYFGHSFSYSLFDDNSLVLLFHNWIFRAELERGMEFSQFVKKSENIKKDITKTAKRKTIKFKEHPERELFTSVNALFLLNTQYGITTKPAVDIDGFEIEDGRATIEDRLFHKMSLILKEKTKFIKISEKKLEKYLMKNLHLLEDGLSFFGRQIALEKGIIDILAKDKDGKLVIIELKVEDDKDLLWQEKYYQDEIEKRFQERPRFMAIAPHLPSHITSYLETDELFEYSVITMNEEIFRLELKKVGKKE